MSLPTNAIIDLSIQLIEQDGEASVSAITVIAATVGVMYYLALDGATGTLIPVALNTIT
jgi:hypothetical protein